MFNVVLNLIKTALSTKEHKNKDSILKNIDNILSKKYRIEISQKKKIHTIQEGGQTLVKPLFIKGILLIQYCGRLLLHYAGLQRQGPAGVAQHSEECHRVLRRQEASLLQQTDLR
jgi:hypothetical protein